MAKNNKYKKIIPLLSVTMLLMGSLSACGSASASKDADPYVGTNQVDNNSANQQKSALPDPLDKYDNSYDEQKTILNAEERYIAKCMTKKGFTYKERSQEPSKKVDPITYPDPRLWGLAVSVDFASKNGYKKLIDSSKNGEETEAPKANSDSKEHLEAVDECNKEVFEQIYFSGETPSSDENTRMQDFHAEAESAALADARVEKLVSDWSSCMKNAGYNYKTPLDAANEPWKKEVDTNEINTAKTDVQCKEKVSLFLNYTKVLYEIEEKLIKEKYLPIFTKQKERMDNRYKRALKILADN